MNTVAVVGGGWAGLAAAVTLTAAGRAVTLFEMAPQLGGRARRVEAGGAVFDNGQHILIGAYTQTLALMRQVGADPDALLQRLPLTLRYPEGHGLQLPGGPAVPAFVRGVLACSDWTWRERLALLRAATGWALRGFRCSETLTVAQLCASLPARIRADLIDPLCIAALNTPAQAASAQVLLRVLRDALFSGPGAADLMLPRQTLDTLLPQPAGQWLRRGGATLHLGRRVDRLVPAGPGWQLDGEPFDAVVLASSAAEAARLTRDIQPVWSAQAAGLAYEPIVTVYLQADNAQLPAPMVALHADEHGAPAQFVFDIGALGGPAGRFAFVISGAAPWVARGREAIEQATLAQAQSAFPAGTWPQGLQLLQLISEKRATFRCTPGLDRPPAAIAPQLWAAGDHVQGPYPATLEGAVRAGRAAAQAVLTGA
ncbi:MAG: FAD-dependent oxidoreductase [Rubrivivax sp.]|nr:FAD-dependent oxidoreductase [Rubrivivax sp.]